MSKSTRLLFAALIAAGSCSLIGCSNQKPLHILKRNGDAAFRGGDYATAEENYAEYVRRKPETHSLRADLARAYLADGRPREAISQLSVALDVSPLNDEYLDLLAQAMLAADERDALITLLRRNAAERGRVSDYIRLGQYSLALGNPDEARESLLTAAKLDGGNTLKPQLALADFYESVGDKKLQTRRLRMAYFIDPSSEEVVQKLIALGETPVPGFGLKPEEFLLTPYVPPAKK